MSMIFHHETPSVPLLENLMKRVNAYGSEPRVLIELDKMVYVPGVKARFDIVEWVFNQQMKHVKGQEAPNPALTEPPNAPSSGNQGEPTVDTERFNYIKCAISNACDQWGLGIEAKKFLMAVCRLETVYGTAGQGRHSQGSFILGYGCPGNCYPQYSGITTQAYYGAKRFAEAMKSRMGKINSQGMSRDDVAYFQYGGDIGLIWAGGSKQNQENWINNVWNFYQSSQIQNLDFNANCPQTLKAQIPDKNILKASSNSGLGKPVFPIAGFTINTAIVTSHSGKNPNSTRPNHRGIDLVIPGGNATNYGHDIVAAWDGTVRVSGVVSGFGEVVYVKHANGWETVYGHLKPNSRVVSVGQQVKAGQKLGEMGNTGNVSPKPNSSNPYAGTHLHFEIWRGNQGVGEWFDPYPILTGAQQVDAASGVSSTNPQAPTTEFKVLENIKVEKCFNGDGTLPDGFINKKGVQWFTVPHLGKKVVGYNKLAKGEDKSFSYEHHFSADGYYEFSLYLDLKQGDTFTVRLDGVTTQLYTSEDSSQHIKHPSPVVVKFANTEMAGANSKIIDFHLHSESGQATAGISCFKVVEVEVVGGHTEFEGEVSQRLIEQWYEVGAFMYNDTFYLEEDIMEWEVNTHFDMASSTARITLNNSKGLYSPHYERTTMFPDNLEESPYTWYENGKIQHIISEGTPIRIYAGYGEDLVRVFTGKIKGEIEENSAERTVSFNCVDMYDELEQMIFYKPMKFPPDEESPGHDDENKEKVMWLKSSIIQAIVREAGLVGWRYHRDDLMHPDFIIEDSVYIDIHKGARKAIKLDEDGTPREVDIEPEKTIEGYLNPYVQTAEFEVGSRASDAIQSLIAETMYRAYCNRYGTFILETIPKTAKVKWEFVDDDNLMALDSSIDYSRCRNHLMITGVMGTSGRVDHYFDKDLIIAMKGNIRTAGIELDWLDERFGANALGAKKTVADRLFFDMKRQARTFNVVVKGNPMIDVLDGCYIYDRNTSTTGYYMVKGNRLVGTENGMVNFLELTWEDIYSDS